MNTIKASEAVWTDLCNEHGVNPQELFKHSHGVKTSEVLAEWFPMLDNTDDKAVKYLEESMGRDHLSSVFAVPGAIDLLKQLDIDTDTGKKFKDKKWAIVTSGSTYIAFGWFKSILSELEKPEVFVTAFDVKNGKPDPEGYSKARDELCKTWNFDVKTAKSVVFEDAPVGIQAGKAMGAITVGITSTYDKKVLFDAGADYVVRDLSQITIKKNTLTGGITLEVKDGSTNNGVTVEAKDKQC